jgi:hypothetical protein
MKDYLTSTPLARERKNKDRAIGNLITNSHGKRVTRMIGDKEIEFCVFEVTKEKLAEIVGDVLTADRAWRKITSENVELRGSDYPEKREKVKRALEHLGYHPYHR